MQVNGRQSYTEHSDCCVCVFLCGVYELTLWVLPLAAGECKPCPRVSVQQCVCGGRQTERPCASPRWQCDQVTFDLHFPTPHLCPREY